MTDRALLRRQIRRHVIRIDVEIPLFCKLGLHDWRETGGGSRSIDGLYPSRLGYETHKTQRCRRKHCRSMRSTDKRVRYV